MNDQEKINKEINDQIAENEARRNVFSQIRVSVWAVLAIGLFAIILVSLYLKR